MNPCQAFATWDESVNQILNRIHAMIEAGIVELNDVAKAVKEDRRNIYLWIIQRQSVPKADAAFKLQAFAAEMSLRIAMHKRFQAPYRSAYHTACVLFPDGRDGQ